MRSRLPTPYVVTFGETMALFRSEHPGPFAHAGNVAVGIGGAESNVAIGLQRLGTSAVWCSRLGSDAPGELVRREIRAEGVHVVASEDCTAPTGVMVKELRTPTMQRVTYYRAHSAASQMTPDDVDSDIVSGAALLHVTGITPALSAQAAATWRQVIARTRDSGVRVSFDVNYRSALWSSDAAAQVYREILPFVDVVFAGEDEAALVLGPDHADDPESLARGLAEFGPSQVIIKRGADGAYAIIDDETYRQDAISIDPVDTVGAGDAFVAGYLAELVDGHDPAQRLHTAVRTGAFACLSRGDWEGLPRRRELELLEGCEPVIR
uniref:sugar kinase n=1 Tax=unclassified Rhodococcus (in: high G+C Gram-positive bacteria) TaxID=192944 RepID=UPI0020CD1D58|nr:MULTISPECIES: sugar kinase [unclassified Rhodococcus (in: high G+C Gram-positive bacteria)]